MQTEKAIFQDSGIENIERVGIPHEQEDYSNFCTSRSNSGQRGIGHCGLPATVLSLTGYHP